MSTRKLSNLKTSLCSVLIALLAFSALPAFVAGQGKFEHEYVEVEWQTSVSQERLIKGEEFYATLDIVSTIKKIPEEYKILVELANKVSATAVIFYEVIGRNNETGEEVVLWSDKISKCLPELKEGTPLEFLNERIPSDGYLAFSQEAKYGRYTLSIRLIQVKAQVLVFTQDVTELIQRFLPPQAFESGIGLSEIELISFTPPPPPGEITICRVGGFLTVTIPVALAGGETLASFTGKDTGITFADNTLTISVADEEGNLQMTLTIHTEDAIGTGTTAEAKVVSMEVETAETTMDFTADDPTLGEVATTVAAELKTLPEGASVKVATSMEPDPEASSAFQLTAADAGMEIIDIAYVINVTKTNLQNVTDVGAATITMKAGAEWIEAHGGVDAIKIFRYDPDTGERQILETRSLGHDAPGRAIFEGLSPSGLSVFALVALAAPPADIAPPAVISVSPTDGAIDVPADTGISVSFSEPMEKSSVEGAFSIKPEVDGKFSWRDNSLTFAPDANLKYSTTYAVTISTAGEDLAGNLLATEFSWTFTTESGPSLWWVWLIIGMVIVGLLIYFLAIRRKRKV